MNILKGSAVYQFKYADCAQQALVAIQNTLKTVQASLLDLSEYRQGNAEESTDRGTGGYDPSKARGGHSDRGGRGRGRGRDYSHRDDRRRDDRFDESKRFDHRYDSRRNDETKRFDDSRRYDRNDRSEKNYTRSGSACPPSFLISLSDPGRRADDVEVDYNYEDDRSGDNEDRTPRVERSGGDHWGRDQDEDDNGNNEHHHRRSGWGNEEDADSDRYLSIDYFRSCLLSRGRQDDRDEESRKRARSPSNDHDDRRAKPVYDQRIWERESIQAQYNRGRGRGRGRGFSRHDTYR